MLLNIPVFCVKLIPTYCIYNVVVSKISYSNFGSSLLQNLKPIKCINVLLGTAYFYMFKPFSY